MPGFPLPELQKGFCRSCARTVSSWLWAKDGRSRWREGWEGVSAGLVSARGSAIHTTQMQVDEVTVIRLSPIVYNKESVKTELLSQIPTLAPHNQSNLWEKKTYRQTETKKTEQQETCIYVRLHIYIIHIKLRLCLYTYMYTRTYMYHKNILGRWGENSQQAGMDIHGEKSRSLHRHFTLSVCTSTWCWCLPSSCWEKQISCCFPNCLGQLQERYKDWLLGGECVEDV